MEKFRTNLSDIVKKHEIVKETEKQIIYINKYKEWKSGNEISREERESKISMYHSWHNTFEEAKNYLISIQENKINRLENQLVENKKRLENQLVENKKRLEKLKSLEDTNHPSTH